MGENVPLPVTRAELDALKDAVDKLATRVAELEKKPAAPPATESKRFKGLLGALLLAPFLFAGCAGGPRVKAGVCYYNEAGEGFCGEIEFEPPPRLPPKPEGVPAPPPTIVIKPEEKKEPGATNEPESDSR